MSFALLAALVLTNSIAQIENPVRISADRTFYDREHSVIVFTGHIKVEDDSAALYADKAIVAMNETNSINRVVAIGNIAVTNGTRRAYGERVLYRTSKHLAVVYGSSNCVARVVDETPRGDREVRGNKLRFWTDSEQVEIVEAEMSSPDTRMELKL